MRPVTCGCTTGVTDPPEIDTLGGAIRTFAGSLLVKEMVTPPGGAGAVKATGNGTDWFVPIIKLLGRVMLPEAAAAFVSIKLAAFASPAADAVTTYVPVNPLLVAV